MVRRFPQLALVCVVLLLSFPASAHAYLDPGSGSFLLQVTAGLALSALYAIKLWWHRLKAFFGGILSRRKTEQ